MGFFLSKTYAIMVGLVSGLSIAGLLYYGHIKSMDPAVATACFVGLLCVIATAAFLTFVALASKLVEDK